MFAFSAAMDATPSSAAAAPTVATAPPVATATPVAAEVSFIPNLAQQLGIALPFSGMPLNFFLQTMTILEREASDVAGFFMARFEKMISHFPRKEWPYDSFFNELTMIISWSHVHHKLNAICKLPVTASGTIFLNDLKRAFLDEVQVEDTAYITFAKHRYSLAIDAFTQRALSMIRDGVDPNDCLKMVEAAIRQPPNSADDLITKIQAMVDVATNAADSADKENKLQSDAV